MTRHISRLLFARSAYMLTGLSRTRLTPNSIHVHFAKQVLKLSAASDCDTVYLFRREPGVFRPELNLELDLDLELHTGRYVSHTTEAACLDMLRKRRKKK